MLLAETAALNRWLGLIVNQTLGQGTDRLGFDFELAADEALEITSWTAFSVNRANASFDGAVVPAASQQAILDELAAATGREVRINLRSRS